MHRTVNNPVETVDDGPNPVLRLLTTAASEEQTRRVAAVIHSPDPVDSHREKYMAVLHECGYWLARLSACAATNAATVAGVSRDVSSRMHRQPRPSRISAASS